MSHMLDNNICNIFYFQTFSFWYFQDPVFMVNYNKNAKKQGIESTKRKKFENKKMLQMFLSNIYDIPKKILDPFLPLFSHFLCLSLTF